MQECTSRNVCLKIFYRPCTSAASQSEFDHANKIPCLKVDVLVYKVSRLSKCQSRLSTYLFSGRFTGRFVVVKQTVFRPVLFSIYTNDLPQHINSKVVMYADDIQILDDQ